MLVPYTKPALSIQDQIALLQKRGMIFSDPVATEAVLQRISYYRLSAYALPWRQGSTNQFAPGITFDLVISHYEFDRVLRDLVWQAIEPIEVAIRTRITHYLSLKYGAFAHLAPGNFRPSNRIHHWDHGAWLAKVHVEAERSHEVFIEHYRKKYDGFPQLPLWMATEIMSFGSLSKMYGAMHSKDQRVIARDLALHETWLPSWLHTLSVIRNTCAHHGRLWDRGLGVKPSLPQEACWHVPSSIPHRDRLGCLSFLLHRLLKEIGAPCRPTWSSRLRDHIAPMASNWSMRMGLPTQWDAHPLWQ